MSVDKTQEAAEDAKFERLLLDSARSDALPAQEVERALQRFTASLGLASLDVEGASRVAQVAHRGLLSWLAVGAIGGGLLSAAWFGLARPWPSAPESAPRSGSAPSAAGAATASASRAFAPASQAPSLAPRASASSEAAAPGRRAAWRSDSGERRQRDLAQAQRVGGASAAPDGAREHERSSAQSALLAEVALLDSVRAKLALHDQASALNLVERYEREFPRGQLSNEAAVLAMEALAASANRAELTRRAQRFLEESPADPHAPKVRRLLAR